MSLPYSVGCPLPPHASQPSLHLLQRWPIVALGCYEGHLDKHSPWLRHHPVAYGRYAGQWDGRDQLHPEQCATDQLTGHLIQTPDSGCRQWSHIRDIRYDIVNWLCMSNVCKQNTSLQWISSVMLTCWAWENYINLISFLILGLLLLYV